jgi:outer membrane protein OmpA-like peptidoglycan-associated protein
MPPPNGSKVRAGHIVMGLALLVMGAAVLVIAFARQAERTHGTEVAPACVGSADANHETAGASHDTAVSAPISSVALSAAIHDAGAALSAHVHDAALESSADAEVDPTGTHDFFFLAGTLALPRDERQKLTALGAALAHHPDIKVSIQGFADQSGADVDAVALARRRARIGEVLLTRVGVVESRMTTNVGDAAADPHLARAIHIVATSTAPAEVDP